MCGCGERWKVTKKGYTEVACDCPKVAVVFEYIDEMACWGPLLLPHLPSDHLIRGHTKPRCFRIKRDAYGVVRHHYRQQLQTSKTTQDYQNNVYNGYNHYPPTDDNKDIERDIQDNLNWCPHNREGFQLFPNEFPNISMVRKVPVKPAPILELKKTLESLKCYLDDRQAEWWRNTIKQFEEEDNRYAVMCSFYIVEKI